jgi:hypothetical protein
VKRKLNPAAEQMVDLLKACGHDPDQMRGLIWNVALIERRAVIEEITRNLPRSRVYHLNSGEVTKGEMLQANVLLTMLKDLAAET